MYETFLTSFIWDDNDFKTSLIQNVVSSLLKAVYGYLLCVELRRNDRNNTFDSLETALTTQLGATSLHVLHAC